MTFQNGFNGYTGTDDGFITSSGGGNGDNDWVGNNALVMLNTASNYESEALVRFNGITLPAGATVTAASVTLTFEDYAGGHNMKAYYVKNAWDANANWVPRTATQNWASPGAKSLGTDISSTTAFTDTSWNATGVVTETYPLDVATVQGWVTTPSTNQGLILSNSVANKALRLYTEDHATPAYHPKLTIEYTTGGGGGTDAGMGGDCATTPASSWAQKPFTAAGAYTAEFDATPSEANTDAVMGFSSGSTTLFTSLQAIARFYTNGVIEARNGSVYTAANSIPYFAGVTYHFRFEIDAGTNTYSVYVKPIGGTETLLGANYAFRADAPDTTTHDNLATNVGTATGSLQICNLTVTPDGGEPPPPTGAHPRIFLDDGTLDALELRAVSTNPAWVTLRDKCDQYIQPGTTISPMPTNGAACTAECSVSSGNICCGYQGSKIHPAVLNLGLCYQVGLRIDHPNASAWGDKGAAVLQVMSQYTGYAANSGFQIRFIATSLAIGYDWLHPKLSTTLKNDIAARLKGWIQYPSTRIDTANNGVKDWWGEHHPVGNYFAGWYAAKAYASLALEGETTDPYLTGMWNDWLNRVHGGGDNSIPPAYNLTDGTPVASKYYGVAEHHTRFINGGGFPGGWEYGGLAIRNMSEPMLACRSAKGLNLINGTTAPAFEYPLNTALHMMHMTWPSRLYMDDRDTIKRSASCPGYPEPPATLATTLTALLAKPQWNKTFAPSFQSYAKEMRDLHGTLLGDVPQQWLDFLFWDESATRVDYTTTQPLSFLSDDSYLAMRSDWGTNATWASLRAMPIADGNTNQYPDAGSLVITRGDVPFIVNPGFLNRCYGSLPNTDWFNHINGDVFGGPRQNFNVFYTGTTSGQLYKYVDDASAPATKISLHEPHQDYVYTRAQDLDDMYSTVTTWTRDVTYFRSGSSNLFVVYDRTSAACGSPRLAWHTPPGLAAHPTIARRWDVNDSLGFKGAISSVLIANGTTALSAVTTANIDNVHSSSKMYRLNIRPTSCATELRWVTVLDPVGGVNAVHATTPINLSNAKGVLLSNGAGSNKVALFGAGQLPNQLITTNVVFSTPAVTTTKLVVADLQGGAKYNVTAPVASGSHTVTISASPTGPFTATPSGTLHVNIALSGGVSAGN